MKVIAETGLNVVGSMCPKELERFDFMYKRFKAELGMVDAKLGKPNLNHLPPKTVIVEQMAQVIAGQARRNKEKATRQSGY